VLHAGKKKTSAEDMARHARLLLKTEALLRTVGHGPSPLPAAVPRARPALRAAGASVDLRHPLPSALSPLESELHSRLRSTLSEPLYMGCRPSELPNITVYSTAYHSTGILHATARYFGEGAWYDGIEAEAIGDNGLSTRVYGRAMVIFAVDEGSNFHTCDGNGELRPHVLIR